MASIKPTTPSITIVSTSELDVSPDLYFRKVVRDSFKQAFAKEASIPTFSPSYFQKSLLEPTFSYLWVVDRVATLSVVGLGLARGSIAMGLVCAQSSSHRCIWFSTKITFAPCAYVCCVSIDRFNTCMSHIQTVDILPTLTQYKSPTTDLKAIVWEFIITFILMFVICGAISDNKMNKVQLGVARGVTILSNVIIAGPITGASVNPVRSIGPSIVSGVYKNLWVFIVAPVLGAMAAILMYNVLQPPMLEINEDDRKVINNNVFHCPDV